MGGQDWVATVEPAMDPDAIALFRELADRSPSEREEYYAHHQIPAALRAELESLLRFDGKTADSIPGCVAAAAESVLLRNHGAAPPQLTVLPRGTKLGPYEVIALKGAGGMGEVYRAHDPRLGRDVAIKVLRRAFTHDTDRLRRFEQEARATAALNHPNILAIHDFGITAQRTPYLVSELLEGDTVRTRLERGALPVRKAIDYALQMIQGLAAAHDKGIVHRDLKPENLFLTTEGRIKVLDLGLAKITRPEKLSQENVAAATVDGLVMGTVGYMSPEQALGQPVDHRTDIFAAGAIIYEMLSGARAFHGETPADVMRAVISQDPEGLRQGTDKIPRALERVVQRCLEKNPDDRFQSARDVAFALEAVSGEPDLAAERSGESRPRPMISRHRRALTLAVAGSVIVLLGGAIYLLNMRRAQPTEVSLEDLRIVQLTTSGNAERPAVSPDGKYVAYIQHDGDAYSLRIRQITTGSNVEIVGAEPRVVLEAVTVTPDGNFVDFVRWDHNPAPSVRDLWRVPFLGGRPKRLIEHVDSPVGWSRDGRHLAFVRYLAAQGASELVIADADGTHERVLATRHGRAEFYSLYDSRRPNLPPAWSWDGRRVALFEWTGSETRVAVLDVATSSASGIPVKGVPTGLAWLDMESLVLNMSSEEAAASQLLRLSYPDGRLSRLSNDPNAYAGISVTADGTSLVTARSETRVGVWVGDAMGSSGTEAVVPAPYPRGIYRMIAWAADHLLYGTADSGNLSISRILPGKGPPEEIVAGGNMPATTWDSQSIVFRNVKTEGISKADSDGRRAVELVSKSYLPYAEVVTRDGQVVFLSGRNGIQAPWIVSLNGGSPTEVAPLFAAVGSVDVSSDGRFVAFRSRDEQNKAIWMICRLPACTMRQRLPAIGQPTPLRWTPDGSLAYVGGQASNIWVQPLDGRPPYQLTQFADRTVVDFAWSRDGKQLAIARASTTNDIVLFKGLKK